MAKSHKGKGGNVTRTVWELAEPYARELGLDIWDVRFVKEGAEHYLRIFIDREDGVSIDDCVNMTHAVDKPLDEADPIDVSYILEVSSPGAERQLTRDEHFQKYIGKRVMVRLIRPLDGTRDFRGVLDGYDGGEIHFTSDEGRSFVFQKKEASYGKADDFADYEG